MEIRESTPQAIDLALRWMRGEVSMEEARREFGFTQKNQAAYTISGLLRDAFRANRIGPQLITVADVAKFDADLLTAVRWMRGEIEMKEVRRNLQFTQYANGRYKIAGLLKEAYKVGLIR